MVGPLTGMITIALVVAVFFGVWLMIRSVRGTAANRRACMKCNQVNPGHAKFCAHCGQPLL